MIDVNVWLGEWPGRRLPFDETSALAARLVENQVAQAWVGSFEMLLHRDMRGVNARLAEECQQHGPNVLIPFGGINPLLPDWEEDLRHCQEVHQMPGIRLTPGYHGYGLDHAEVGRLFAVAVERGVAIQVVVRMEDERTQHPALKASEVDVKPLGGLLAKHPEARVMLLNALHNAGVQTFLSHATAKRVMFEIATLEGVGGIEKTLKSVAADRLCFGSHFPFFVWESAKLKLTESALPPPIRERVSQLNAEEWIRK